MTDDTREPGRRPPSRRDLRAAQNRRTEPDPTVTDLGEATFRGVRDRAADERLRAEFADLRRQVQLEVLPPPVSRVTPRRHHNRVTLLRGPLAAAAAVLLVGGASLLTTRGPWAGGGTAVASGLPGAATSSSEPTATPKPTPTQLPPQPVKTVVVTVTPKPPEQSPRRTRTPIPKPSKPAPTVTVPTTDVTVYLWQGSLYPACSTQYPVTRRIAGSGNWADIVRAALAGTTAAERAQGYVSPFGPGVDVEVDEATHTVNFTSTAVIDDAVPACRGSLESIIARTAAEAGSNADIQLEGRDLAWVSWKLGLG